MKKLLIFMLIVLVGYGAVYVLHPMPFIVKLDIESVEVTDRNDIIIYKTDDPNKVNSFLDLFKYNTPYLPWQSNSSWKKITPAGVKAPPDLGFIFKNDLGEVRYSFFVRQVDPAYVQIRTGFFLPWSKQYFPKNPALSNWQEISGTAMQL